MIAETIKIIWGIGAGICRGMALGIVLNQAWNAITRRRIEREILTIKRLRMLKNKKKEAEADYPKIILSPGAAKFLESYYSSTGQIKPRFKI